MISQDESVAAAKHIAITYDGGGGAGPAAAAPIRPSVVAAPRSLSGLLRKEAGQAGES